MRTIILVRGKKINVQFTPHIVRINTDKELKDLLRNDVKKATSELVSAVKSEYKKQFFSELKISDRSMSVEIWGHAYADEISVWIQKHFRIRLLSKIAGKIIYHASLIDIGERKHDSNRIVWDCLAPFLSVLALFLP